MSPTFYVVLFLLLVCFGIWAGAEHSKESESGISH